MGELWALIVNSRVWWALGAAPQVWGTGRPSSGELPSSRHPDGFGTGWQIRIQKNNFKPDSGFESNLVIEEAKNCWEFQVNDDQACFP